MIELPEALVLASQINRTLTGRQITQAIANASPHKFAWYSGDPAGYHQKLAGKTIDSATSHGGHIEILVGDMLLVLSAPLRYHPPGEKTPAKHQLLLRFDDGSALSLTIHMWGGVFCFPAGETGGMADYHIALERPSPFGPAFDRSYFDSLFGAETPQLSAKSFLATEQRVPGLGNGVLQDILWAARIHPRRKIGELSAADIQTMYASVKSVLRAMADCGGRDTERDLFGSPGGYITVLSKNTAGKGCPGCGSLIQKEVYMGGSIYFCAGCQPRT